MKTQITRISHNPNKRYSGIYQQQGRMFTDSDWNELVEIIKQYIQESFKQTVGTGSPAENGFFEIKRDEYFNITLPPAWKCRFTNFFFSDCNFHIVKVWRTLLSLSEIVSLNVDSTPLLEKTRKSIETYFQVMFGDAG